MATYNRTVVKTAEITNSDVSINFIARNGVRAIVYIKPTDGAEEVSEFLSSAALTTAEQTALVSSLIKIRNYALEQLGYVEA